MRPSSFIVLGVLSAVLGVASAHAYLETSDPTTGATLRAAPEQLTLAFSEPLELRFSTFSMASLESNATDPREIKLAAQDLIAEVLGSDALSRGHHDRGDAESDAQGGAPGETPAQPSAAQLDVEILTSGRTSREVVLGLPDLAPGTYVVMWRLLSADTHASDDFVTFTVAPPADAADGN